MDGKRLCLILIVCLLTLYPPVELTRLIVAYGLDTELILELVALWVLYLSGIVLAYCRRD